ncbi:MAG: rhodanese-like domain-containing protein [Oscillospiraceae bacterium]|uniref:rhodanese-like domain-containing protein n=1 Tax=Eubacterium sp. TaxID=142586 RepID=UPI0025C074F0|nr:rhodanese-like domain-containing protein [Eubacterium sp.]MCI7801087.1 rhodanese-like domain-containing protein [Eubacterium sp.]MDD6355300.1 rhodanese-like domain-containing protein [Oscillospiraceae bacterium]
MSKKIILLALAIITVATVFAGCTQKTNTEQTEATQVNIGTYYQIPQDEAKRIMDEESDYIIVDAREQSEYDEGHIKGAIVIPYTEIEQKAEEMLPDKEQLILVYCRSGRRSKIAAQSLANMGYTNVKEFGGIIDWQYGIEK